MCVCLSIGYSVQDVYIQSRRTHCHRQTTPSQAESRQQSTNQHHGLKPCCRGDETSISYHQIANEVRDAREQESFLSPKVISHPAGYRPTE